MKLDTQHLMDEEEQDNFGQFIAFMTAAIIIPLTVIFNLLIYGPLLALAGVTIGLIGAAYAVYKQDKAENAS